MIKSILNSIVPGWVTEYKFHPKRRWRFDYFNLKLKIAIEINGGAWISGRHTRGKGFINDMEKLNQAQMMGYMVLQYTPQQLTQMVEDITKITKEGR